MHCCVPVVFDLFYSIGLWSFFSNNYIFEVFQLNYITPVT